jgi:HSP20 family protein
MLALWNQMDDLFNDDLLRNRRATVAFTPAVDIVETKSGYRLTADVPGLSADEIDITVESGTLTISGERKTEQTEEKEGYRRIERSFGQFRRSFSLPKGVDLDGIQATVENGQLVLEIPKPVAELPRKVRVSAKAPELNG